MQYEYLIALKQITHRRGHGFISLISFISVAGIAVGVMALIVVLSVMSGFDRELKTKMIGANPHVLVLKSGGVDNAHEVIGTIKELNLADIVTIAPYVEGQVIVRSATNATGAIIKGLSKTDESIQGIETYVKQGSLRTLFEDTVLEEGGEPVGSIALGYQVARLLNVRIGDMVQVISPSMEKKMKLLPKGAKTRTYHVSALFEFGMNSMDSSLVLVSIDQGRDLFNLGDTSSGIAIRVRDVFIADRIKNKIQLHLGYPYWTQSWIDMNKSFFSALKVEKNVMSVLLFLIILVAGFNIISTLIMVVMEKTKDIGILKALGARNGSVATIFLFQGMIVGVLGVVGGALAGLAITFNVNSIAAGIEKITGFEIFPSDIYYFNEIPTQINPHDIMIIIVSALLISVIAGLYPARRAVVLNPVEALRYE
ncbi:MAG: lipoprotein-releasing ABC transporter permease subunit [Candidatus Omnitrophica bacterium]|nr:lipoprotein-releasing ABC transporter permease subunit [Candidatus Omnitrophota bacterium]